MTDSGARSFVLRRRPLRVQVVRRVHAIQRRTHLPHVARLRTRDHLQTRHQQTRQLREVRPALRLCSGMGFHTRGNEFPRKWFVIVE